MQCLVLWSAGCRAVFPYDNIYEKLEDNVTDVTIIKPVNTQYLHTQMVQDGDEG